MLGSVRAPWKLLALFALLFAACGPAAQATPTPAPQAPTATPAAVAQPTPTGPAAIAATATPTPKPAPTTAPEGPKSGGVLRTIFRNDPEDWDPHKALGGAPPLRSSTSAVFSPLLTRDWPAPGQCGTSEVPVLAESWKWVDSTTFEVKIRQDVKFHNKPPVNGRSLTIQDVAYSLERLRKEATYIRSLTDQISGVQVSAPDTVRITTKGPFPGLFTSVLSNYYGAEVVLARESGGTEELWREPEKTWIGSGPFMFERYVPGVKATLVRNPAYFRTGLPHVASVEFLVTPDLATRVSLMRAGKLEILPELSVISVEELQKTAPSIQVFTCPADQTLLLLWMRTDKAPWSDVRVRRAVSMAIDQQAMIASVLQGKAVWTSSVPASHPYALKKDEYPPEVRQYLEPNPEGARKLLAEAGYPKGFDAVMQVPRYWGSPRNELMELSISQLAEIGIRVRPVWQERATFTTTTQRGDYPDITWRRMGAYDMYQDEIRFHSKSPPTENRGYVNDPEMDKLIDELFITFDEARQKALMREIQIRKASQAYVVIAPNAFAFWTYRHNVRGVGAASVDVFQQIQPLLEKVWLQ